MSETRDYIVICQSAWMNESGFGINYGWDGERFPSLKKAIKHGFDIRGSDDFNTAEVIGDRLVWFGWMDEQMDEDAAEMAEIASQAGLVYAQNNAPQTAETQAQSTTSPPLINQV